MPPLLTPACPCERRMHVANPTHTQPPGPAVFGIVMTLFAPHVKEHSVSQGEPVPSEAAVLCLWL